MRHFRSRTGAFKREVKSFGDLVTFDFVTASGMEGRYALIIRDIYTGLIMACTSAVGGKSNRCTRMMAQS